MNALIHQACIPQHSIQNYVKILIVKAEIARQGMECSRLLTQILNALTHAWKLSSVLRANPYAQNEDQTRIQLVWKGWTEYFRIFRKFQATFGLEREGWVVTLTNRLVFFSRKPVRLICKIRGSRLCVCQCPNRLTLQLTWHVSVPIKALSTKSNTWCTVKFACLFVVLHWGIAICFISDLVLLVYACCIG